MSCTMNKLFFCLIVAAFASLGPVQAGECCDKNKAASAGKDCNAKSACCAGKAVAKKADVSVKGATLLVRR